MTLRYCRLKSTKRFDQLVHSKYMKIVSDFGKDIQSKKPNPGSYEWWYFDAVSVDSVYSIVVIFYDGNPFSKRYIRALDGGGDCLASDFPAISISIYREGRPIYYGFEEVEKSDAEFSASRPEGSVKKNRFDGVMNEEEMLYTLHLDHEVQNGDRLTGELEFRSSQTEMGDGFTNKDDRGGDHVWNLVQPKSKVQGELQISGFYEETISFEGRGYHDHNTGNEPMKKSFTEWYWGRFHLEDSTLVFYLMLENGEWIRRAWLLGDDGSVTSVADGENIKMEDRELTMFGLKSARKIEYEGEALKFFIQQDSPVDSGPFYQRYLSRLILEKSGDIEQATGITEYIYPGRIYQKIFWPLVDMRISYPGESHWVQNSPRLYRWTW